MCCLLVLDSVTSTPQWIRRAKPRGCVHDMCVFVCECVLGRSRVSQPLNLRLCLLQHFGFLTSPRAIKIRSRCHLSSSCLGSWARRAIAAVKILPPQSRQQASQTDGPCRAVDEPHNASAMLPSGGAEWLVFTDAAHLVLDRPKLASESGRSKSA